MLFLPNCFALVLCHFKFIMPRQMLTGSDSPNARFGTAIASLSDISKDEFNGRYSRTECETFYEY